MELLHLLEFHGAVYWLLVLGACVGLDVFHRAAQHWGRTAALYGDARARSSF